MMTLIIKSYFILLLSIGLGSIIIFLTGCYFIFKRPVSPETDSEDILAIAGDDVITTQLDLARAYIETGRKQLAKTILESVAQQGSAPQQQEARHLLLSVLSG